MVSPSLNAVIDYIKEFLLYGHREYIDEIYYGELDSTINSKVIILSNGLLGDKIQLPDLEPIRYEIIENRIIIKTDIIYTTFFFLSLAEESVISDRDEHGRLLSRHSVLNTWDKLVHPVIDEYSTFLLSFFKISLPLPGFQHIYLTHDVDIIASYRHLRGMIGGLIRGQGKKVWESIKDIEADPAFSFGYLESTERMVEKSKTIYFIKDTPGYRYDYPQYNLRGKDYQYLQTRLLSQGCILGWHSSYYECGVNIKHQAVEDISIDYKHHRSHYLQISAERLRHIENLGVTDDYTAAFADMAGFRCQTTRSFRWIDYEKMRVSNITIHPLTVMDVSLSAPHYMNLSFKEALNKVDQLIGVVNRYNGELVLLWHNTSIQESTYHGSLYSTILHMLR